MTFRNTFMRSLFARCFLVAVAVTAQADNEPCGAFAWNIQHERALFAGTAEVLHANASGAVNSALVPDHLYEISLQPQSGVTFTLTPGKKMLADGAFAATVPV